ncbi:MAG: signal peptidase I, partial [Candidatus Hydrogenedentales bacterium]
LKREILDFVKLIVWFLIIFLGLRTYVIEGYEVQGPSMTPTLENNERILVLKLPHILSQYSLFSGMNPIESGDIVVFDSPDAAKKRYVKRVIGVGPDAPDRGTVAATSESADPPNTVPIVFDRGEVYVNNVKVEEDYLTEEARRSADTDKLELEPGQYYVLGDNRRVSKDSRSFHAIDDDQIIGKAVLRFWPPNKISLLR